MDQKERGVAIMCGEMEKREGPHRNKPKAMKKKRIYELSPSKNQIFEISPAPPHRISLSAAAELKTTK